MLFVHETHRVAGDCEDAFEAAYREGWMSALAAGDGARLLWYCHQVHGTGPSYTVVTITGLRDASAWATVGERVRDGDLQSWAADVDRLRHQSTAKVLVPVPWSPMQAVDLASVATDGRAHELSLYMEDTGWPRRGRFADYIAVAGAKYFPSLERTQFLRMEAAWRPAWGAGPGKELVLMQKVVDHARLLGLLTHEVAAEHRAPGTWMHDALDVRDDWESRLLRTSSWSPLW